MRQDAVQALNAGLPFRRINFVAARDPAAHSVTPHVDLVPLNAEMPSMLPLPPTGREAAAANLKMSAVADDRPEPAAAFCSENAIRLTWSSTQRAGSGLVNLGNTCFMNSVLQALTHTPPLAELCLREAGLSTSAAERQHMDPIVGMQAHIKKALSAPNAVQPVWHARNLKAINRRFRLGRQEDAHEYLRCVLDAMHEAFLKHIKPKPPPELAATTFIHRIFGGKLRSEIVCEGVNYSSSTFDPFLDLSLEINKAHSLSRALQHFTAEEVLDGDNRYRCPKNNKLVRAYKRISIENAPNVLTVHLKRFDFFGRGHKISRKVEFDMQLDLGPFMTSHLQRRHKHKHKQQQQQQQHAGGSVRHHPVMYDLYAVLVHHGHSLHSGHYVCYVKAGNGIWHHCDDHRVAQVSERMVQGQQAYILFYVRRQPKGAAAPAAASAKAAAAAALGQAAASAAAAAAVAANKQQQREQRRQQQQQQDRAQVAGGVAAAAGQQAGGACVDEAGKVVASSTQSTANASPAAEGSAAQQPLAREDSLPALTPNQLHAQLHNHHHFTRSRGILPALSSFERHIQFAQEAAAMRRSHSKRLSLLQAHNGLNGKHHHHHHHHHQQQPAEGQQQQQQQAPRGLLGGSPAKQPRRIRPQAVVLDDAVQQQEQEQLLQTRPLKRLKQQEQQREQQVSDGLQEQPSRLAAADDDDGAVQHAKRRKHKHKSSSGEQPQQQANQQLSLDKTDQQQPQQQPQQQQPPQAPAVVQQPAPRPPAAMSPAAQQQAVPVGPTVMGAAALELLMSASKSKAGPAARGWEGGDTTAAVQAAALQRAAQQQGKRGRDEWDVEYDRGKTKKVRSKQARGADEAGEDALEASAGGNRFQQAWQEQLPQKARQEAWKGMDGSSQQRRGGGGRHSRGRGGGHRGGRHGMGGRGRGPGHGRGGGFGGGRGRGGGRGGGGGRGRGRGRGR